VRKAKDDREISMEMGENAKAYVGFCSNVWWNM
jgi:hypothetical protein